MSELKPCPFCGSEAEYYSDCEMVKVRCSNYDCLCELITTIIRATVAQNVGLNG